MKKDGFSEIYDIYFPKLLRFTRTYLISEDESENIVQEIFIYLWEHRDIIETLQNLNAYLFTLAKNRCIDYFRKEMVREVRKGSLSEIENRELQLKLYSLEAFDNDRLSDADIEEILNNAINRLPERCREIFIMSRLQNLRYKEIAEKLNVSPNTVENQIVIALRKLKEDLKDYFPLFVSLSEKYSLFLSNHYLFLYSKHNNETLSYLHRSVDSRCLLLCSAKESGFS